MLGPSHRSAYAAAIGVCVAITIWLNLDRLQRSSLGSQLGSTTAHTPPSTSTSTTTTHDAQGHLPSPAAEFFNQVFAPSEPNPYDFPALRENCDRTEWHEDVYLQCGGMFAGLTSIISEVKVCLKMAVEAGTGIILPAMPLRDSTNLKEFNIENDNAYMPYDQWFDAKHLISGLSRACPRLKVLHPDQMKPASKAGKVTVKNNWEIDIFDAPGYRQYTSHFWAGNPFKPFFDSQLAEFQKAPPSRSGKGISVIKINAIFLLFRITDDPTGADLKLWNDLGLLIRFLEKPRRLVGDLLAQMNRPFYGVHFRVENDTIWSSLDTQLNHDLDALDQAWSMYRKDNGITSSEKPLVYLACGDEEPMRKFISAGKARGWDVTHKWELARQSARPETLKMIDELPFDFQGAVDMGIMIQSHFFIGISGSAFSSSVANARDVTGRYRGSSLRGLDDGGARSYLVSDGVASSYPCCL